MLVGGKWWLQTSDGRVFEREFDETGAFGEEMPAPPIKFNDDGSLEGFTEIKSKSD